MISKEKQISIILFGEPWKWVSNAITEDFFFELKREKSVDFVSTDDILTVSVDEVYGAAKKNGIEKFCDHYDDNFGDGVCLYKAPNGMFRHSAYERGKEHILGEFDTMELVERSLIIERIKCMERCIKGRIEKLVALYET